MPLANVSVTGHLAATQTNAPAAHDLATTTPANFPLSLFKQVTYTDGTGAGQADRLFADNRSISGNDELFHLPLLVAGRSVAFRPENWALVVHCSS